MVKLTGILNLLILWLKVLHKRTRALGISGWIQRIWKHGRKNPPSKIKVKILKEDNIVKAELIDKPFEEIKKPEEEEKVRIKLPFTKKEETKEEKEISEEEKEKKEVLEHAKLIKKERKTKAFIEKTKPTQEQKRAGIIGGTGKK